jgi:hypothetical protein
MRTIVLFLAVLIATVTFSFAKQYATTDSGKRVILHDDGTWEYTASQGNVLIFDHDFRKATWGMTIDQVKETEESPIVFEGWSDTEDATVLHYKEKVFRFQAFITYIFKDGKLVQARYAFDPQEKEDYIEDYETVIEALIDKYGEPIDIAMEWSDSTYIHDEEQWEKALRLGHLKRTGVWETKKTSMTLVLYGEDNTIIMQIDYRDRKYLPDSEL